MDIEQLLETADENTIPLLQYTLSISDSRITLPKEYTEKIRDFQWKIAPRNMFLFDAFKRVLQRFDEAGIEVIVLKGAMMQGIYPPGVRYFGDLDILVRMEKILQVKELLSGMDYRSIYPQLRPGTEAFQTELHYVKDGPLPIEIEPHWKLIRLSPYSWRVKIEDLWQRAQKTSIMGIETRILSPEDSLLHFCLHFIQHKNQRWIHPVCDIAALIQYHKSDFDWDEFLRRVFEYKLSLPVYESLQKTSELFTPPIPSFVFDMLARHKAGRFDKWAFNSLSAYKDKKTQINIVGLLDFFAVPIALKFRFLRDMFFPNRDFLIFKYPELQGKSLFSCYLYRLKDIVVKGVKGLICLVTKKD